MEDDLNVFENVRRPQSIENGRRHKFVENERQPQRKTKSMFLFKCSNGR
jgi:hypothetical protein